LYKLKRNNLFPFPENVRICKVCPLCNTMWHNFTTCEKFTLLRRNTTRSIYCSKKLEIQDEAGFIEGAIIPIYVPPVIDNVDQAQILLENDTSGVLMRPRFIRGDRESCLKEGKYSLETSLETALELLSRKAFSFLECEEYAIFMRDIEDSLNSGKFEVIWLPDSKTALYLVKISSTPPTFFPRFTIVGQPIWHNLSDTNISEEYNYVKPIIKTMVEKV
jgi:hypothetical protein